MWMLSSDNGIVAVPLIAKNGGTLIAARVFYLKQVPVHPLTNTSLSSSLLRLRPVPASHGAASGWLTTQSNVAQVGSSSDSSLTRVAAYSTRR